MFLNYSRSKSVSKGAASWLIVIMVSVVLSACGGKNKSVAKQAEESKVTTTSDITRPPAVIKEVTVEEESNPDETISFDEWRRRRQLEQQTSDE